MTVAAYSSLVITDGTTTATLTDGTNYQLIDGGWSPTVAPLRASTLGGSGPYADVTEQITVNVRGSTGATCLANLAKLSQLLDQAERWARGEPVTAVLLTCQPQGSTQGAALSCAIMGRAGETAVNPPATFNDLLMIFEIPNVQISIRRRGLWLEAAETVVGTGYACNPAPQAIAFAAAATTSSPVRLRLVSNFLARQASYLLTAPATDLLRKIEAETLDTVTAPWSQVSDSTNHASGNTVLRYTPASTALERNTVAVSGFATTVRRVAVFLAVRNNSTTRTFRLRIGGSGASGGEVRTPDVYIDTSSQTPRIIYAGSIVLQCALNFLAVEVVVDSVTGSPTLDIDYIVLQAQDDECAGVLAIMPLYNGVDGGEIDVDPNPLSRQNPVVTLGPYSSPTVAVNYAGDAYLSTRGGGVAFAFLAPGGYVPASWVCVDSGGTVVTITPTATRWRSYLTPQ